MRRAAASFFCLCLFAGDASACFMEADHSSIFLREPFAGLDAPVIAQISIRKIVSEFVPYKIGAVGSPIWIGWYVADARVDKLLRGHLDQDRIRILAPGTDCDDVLRTGLSGTVAGRLNLNTYNDKLELILISESDADRRDRAGNPK